MVFFNQKKGFATPGFVFVFSPILFLFGDILVSGVLVKECNALIAAYDIIFQKHFKKNFCQQRRFYRRDCAVLI